MTIDQTAVQLSVGQLYSFPEGLGWCRHGILVVKAHPDGTLYLQDTYWGTDHYDQNSTKWSPEFVSEKGLKFLLDLSSARDVRREEWDRYAEADKAFLPIGGGSARYLVRKDAVEDSALVEAQHLRSIEDAESQLRRAQYGLDWAKQQYEEWKSRSN